MLHCKKGWKDKQQKDSLVFTHPAYGSHGKSKENTLLTSSHPARWSNCHEEGRQVDFSGPV